MGRIAAGVPIEAIQTRLDTIEVPPELLSKGEHFALEVKGNSMIEAGILEGDTIIVGDARTPITAISSWPWSTRRKRR